MPAVQETTVPPREVELKLQLGPDSEAILRADAIFGPAARRVHLITTYHDTLYNLSRDTGVGLASSRHEWEWPVANSTPQIGKLAGVVELASIAEKLADRLEPVIVTDVWRTSRLHSLADGAAAEASLDIGHVAAGGKSEPICELELELKHGPMAPLFRLALWLAETAPLWISPQSKVARGWLLRNGHSGSATTFPKPNFGKKLSVSAGLHQIIGALLSHLTANIAPALAGDPEALRQMRGALRNLRAALRLFAPMLAQIERTRFDGPLRQFAQTLGAARDWDVFCLQTLPAAIFDLPDVDWKELSALAGQKRATKHATVHEAICGPQFTRLILNLALWAETCKSTPLDIGTKQLNKRLSKIAPALLDKIAEKADRAGRHLGRLPMPELHDFRKALDRLNVAVRFLGSAYPKSAVTAYRKRSDAVRDIIGAANDAEVTKALALDLAADGGPAVSACAAALTTWAGQRQKSALTGLKQAARRFRTGPAFWGV